LPDELKAARRRCKTPEDVAKFFAFAAGPPDAEDEKNEDAQDRTDVEKEYFPPSVFEWEPNPVIFSHMRVDYHESSHSSPSVAQTTSDYHLMDLSAASGGFNPNTPLEFDNEGTAIDTQKSTIALRPSGPATISVNLSSFACSQCPYVGKKKHELKYEIMFYLADAHAD
jgi:hypothetical protein